jgi:hypothetical protein
VLLSDVIAIDGKTLCNSFDSSSGAKAIHMFSAFVSGARLILAHKKPLKNRLLSKVVITF